jgi:hypothetical protein
MCNKNTKIICAFPGTGKTTLYTAYRHNTLKVLDSDSSKFDKTGFPNNYIQHIKDNIGIADIILVSSHEETRKALLASNIDFYLVYPAADLKDECISRYRIRGNSSLFIELIEKYWHNWLSDCRDQIGCTHIELPSMIFLCDVIDDILKV